MQTIVDINPLKPGKLDAYKAFAAEITGPRKKEFADLLQRYGLKTVNAYYHKINDVDFVIVVHLAEDDARKRLENFNSSKNAMDQWFIEQLNEIHDFEPLNGKPQSSTPLFAFNPSKLKTSASSQTK